MKRKLKKVQVIGRKKAKPIGPEIPDANWGLKRLASFCHITSRNLAKYKWLLGKAMNVAKEKVPFGEWEEWVEENCPGVSKSSYTRYMKVARECGVKDVEGSGITRVYRGLKMVQEVTPVVAVDSNLVGGEQGAPDQEENPDHSWVVANDPQGEPEVVEPDEIIREEELPSRESCQEHLTDVLLPFTAKLAGALGVHFAFAQADRRQALNTIDGDVAKKSIDALMLALQGFGKELPKNRLPLPKTKKRAGEQKRRAG